MKADYSDTLNKGSDSEAASRMHSVIEKFKAMWASFWASSEGKGSLTNRGSYLVAVEKLRSETFAELVRKEMPGKDSDP